MHSLLFIVVVVVVLVVVLDGWMPRRAFDKFNIVFSTPRYYVVFFSQKVFPF